MKFLQIVSVIVLVHGVSISNVLAMEIVNNDVPLQQDVQRPNRNQDISNEERKRLNQALLEQSKKMIGDVQLCRYLIAQGAQVNYVGNFGYTPLFWAACNGDVERVRLLLDSGAEVDESASGFTALHAAAWGEYGCKAPDGFVTVIRLLLECGATLDSVDMLGLSPLHSAISSGQIAIVKAFLDAGASISSEDRNGNTPFLHAVFKGKRNLVHFFLERGVPIEERLQYYLKQFLKDE